MSILLAFEAENQTGLTARKLDATKNPEMACQLGRIVIERRSQPKTKQHGEFIGEVSLLLLEAWGETFEEAIEMRNRKRRIQ